MRLGNGAWIDLIQAPSSGNTASVSTCAIALARIESPINNIVGQGGPKPRSVRGSARYSDPRLHPRRDGNASLPRFTADHAGDDDALPSPPLSLPYGRTVPGHLPVITADVAIRPLVVSTRETVCFD